MMENYTKPKKVVKLSKNVIVYVFGNGVWISEYDEGKEKIITLLPDEMKKLKRLI